MYLSAELGPERLDAGFGVNFVDISYDPVSIITKLYLGISLLLV